MTISRTIGQAPRTQALANELNGMNGPCIGCVGCQGVCQALIEVMVLPDLIISERRT
jgi:formate hydrogenlyase subunit 6/NADH:ubiquinone oxidoreductase subunit I